MAKQTSIKIIHIKQPPFDKEYILSMSNTIDELRSELWKVISKFETNNNMPISDVAMTLGIVIHELVHHSDENK